MNDKVLLDVLQNLHMAAAHAYSVMAAYDNAEIREHAEELAEADEQIKTWITGVKEQSHGQS
jgi:hypothetical protein